MSHARDPLYRRRGYPAEVIGDTVWLYFRFPLSLLIEEILAARAIIVSHETIRCWAEKFGREFSSRIRRRAASLRSAVLSDCDQRFLPSASCTSAGTSRR